MARTLPYEAITLLVLFALYAAWLIAKGSNPLRSDAWGVAPIVILIAVSTLATLFGIAVLGRFNAGPAGSAYVPAHVEGGKLVPSRIEPPAKSP